MNQSIIQPFIIKWKHQPAAAAYTFPTSGKKSLSRVVRRFSAISI